MKDILFKKTDVIHVKTIFPLAQIQIFCLSGFIESAYVRIETS